MEAWIQLVLYDIQCYGKDVVAAFGEYCGHQKRFLCRCPRLRHDLRTVSAMVGKIMKGRW